MVENSFELLAVSYEPPRRIRIRKMADARPDDTVGLG
jgi:hypothetical protein